MSEPSTETMLDMMRVAGAQVEWHLENKGTAFIVLCVKPTEPGASLQYQRDTGYSQFITEIHYAKDLESLIEEAYREYLAGRWENETFKFKVKARLGSGFTDARVFFGSTTGV